VYREIILDCQKHGAFDPSTMGHVSNVGLMAQKAEARVCVCVCVYVGVGVYRHIHIYTHEYKHTYMRIHTGVRLARQDLRSGLERHHTCGGLQRESPA
jgi:phosphopantetheine adenylyltransferase